MKYIGKIYYTWANPNQKEQDEGNTPKLIYCKDHNNLEEALKEIQNKAKQQSIAILKAKFNKYSKLPICRYFIKIENSWLIAEGKAKQGKLYDEWKDKEEFKDLKDLKEDI